MVCPRCGEENPDRARFCLACGAPLEPGRVGARGAKGRVGALRRSRRVHHDVGVRRSEDVRARLQAYHSRAKAEVERYGGTLEKFIGDAVMAVFGAPASHEDDAERAVRAGLVILERVSELELEARAAVTAARRSSRSRPGRSSARAS